MNSWHVLLSLKSNIPIEFHLFSAASRHNYSSPVFVSFILFFPHVSCTIRHLLHFLLCPDYHSLSLLCVLPHKTRHRSKARRRKWVEKCGEKKSCQAFVVIVSRTHNISFISIIFKPHSMQANNSWEEWRVENVKNSKLSLKSQDN